MDKNELKIETMRGQGPGGQHKNKTDSAVKITHIPSGLSAYADERSQRHSKKKALADLEQKLARRKADKLAAIKKERRDHVIHNTPIIRTYDYSRGIVKDHRTKKTASLKDVIKKGKFYLLNP